MSFGARSYSLEVGVFRRSLGKQTLFERVSSETFVRDLQRDKLRNVLNEYSARSHSEQAQQPTTKESLRFGQINKDHVRWITDRGVVSRKG